MTMKDQGNRLLKKYRRKKVYFIKRNSNRFYFVWLVDCLVTDMRVLYKNRRQLCSFQIEMHIGHSTVCYEENENKLITSVCTRVRIAIWMWLCALCANCLKAVSIMFFCLPHQLVCTKHACILQSTFCLRS